jgi:hypothetical protein
MRGQLYLSHGEIHLRYPVLECLQRSPGIAHQQAIGAFVYRQAAFWAKELFGSRL